MLEALVRSDPERFYVGSRGWVALRLDLDEIGWAEARELLADAYRGPVPRRLAS